MAVFFPEKLARFSEKTYLCLLRIGKRTYLLTKSRISMGKSKKKKLEDLKKNMKEIKKGEMKKITGGKEKKKKRWFNISGNILPQ